MLALFQNKPNYYTAEKELSQVQVDVTELHCGDFTVFCQEPHPLPSR